MSPCIGIDYTAALEQGGGIGRYVRELTRALAELDRSNEYQLFAAGLHRDLLPDPPGRNFHWRPSHLNPRAFARIWHRVRLPIPIELWTGRLDLLHAPDFTLPPTLKGVKTLLTVHDLSFITRPETAHPALKRYLDVVVPRSISRADHVLADSEATKNDILHYFGVAEAKVTVLYSGVDARFKRVVDLSVITAMRAKYQIPAGPYLLSVGTVSPRKNFGRLAAALKKSGLDHTLVIAGGKGWLEDPLYQTIESLGLSKRVVLTGFIDDADLPALYSGADLFALVSLYEGFGLPVLEALACGTPVITSNSSSLPEVAGDAALLVDPLEEDGIATALNRFTSNNALRMANIAKGNAQAARFTWSRAASQLHSIYLKLLES